MRITMDRYGAEWAMVARGWRTHVHGQGRHFASASDAVKTLYAEDPKIDDQHLPAFIVGDYAGMKDGDAIILTNFRGDRAVEITEAFEGRPGFAAFDRGVVPQVSFAGMMRYDGDLALPSSFLVQPPEIADTVGERLAAAGLRVFATSETQKFGHVTYFFNGNRSAPLAGEVWKELPSFAGGADAHPEMRAAEIAAAVVQALDAGGYHHIRFNLANGDMVGHTGDFAATVRAVEAADAALAQVWAACAHHGALLLVTADHGNADEMFKLDKAGRPLIAADGQPMPSSSHSLNPVPFILLDPTGRWTLKQGGGQSGGGLAQIGATLLELCGLQAPASYLPSLVTPTGAQP